jgi:pyrimidine-nucleoside phosphorylase
MRMVDLILKKRNSCKLTKEEIEYIVNGYVKGEIPDYQVSSLFMAIFFKGMSDEETANLTMTMVNSGDVVDLSSIPGIKVDKHSTGGVGDTTTLILAPLVAAAGIPVAKMSGRGLGHTGGTLDKLESIPGFDIKLKGQEFLDAVKDVGASIVGQTQNLVPADAKFYALRDVTGTIESIPLIASSIMSKKIAAGADAIVLDVKTGSGAFMKTLEDSFALAKAMVDIGTNVGRDTMAVITDMDQPLGMAIGNALEVKEAIEVLKGEAKGQLKDVALTLGAYMLKLAKKADTLEQGIAMLDELIENGKAAEKFKEIIARQGGDKRVVDDLNYLPLAKNIIEVKAETSGYVNKIKTQQIGHSAMILGAGRETKQSEIDLTVGMVLKKRVGEIVNKGDVLAEFYINDESKFEEAKRLLLDAYEISSEYRNAEPLIYGIVTKDGIDRVR